ncbi:2-C-methyl-D-erythritol 4-phosphate cytidylyltransferase [Deinococcus maricopensis]|uniref:2-C-methyl-D-erythritol 4-phosphate cytidylyltransferase n=1 Tax=Deinococcus maricopensis (strain DSM 21211 / LMG 22137 / NRRL B-23946 / LB-34) TaxID=709986 RepID=E8U6L3_DEIML|nr:2-C-methyl-D-erythritol 4-phosphate cytidylyltransferase [Deinococcus maricopensis]ADV66702.1 2-C-methyl-D-erythritol 4-phosphate cytidylyltransferase [Deinococcus maricopensis DSM 21211]
MKVAALIPAAGSGTRLGLGPKAYVEVAGRSLLAWSVAALAPHADEVLVALPGGLALPRGVPARTVVGGATRQASVQQLLRATDADVVLVHDAARPFVPARVVQDVRAAAQADGAATAALPCADTLVRADAPGSARWGEAVPRADMWAVQTPQGFARAVLLAAHAQAEQDGFEGTDDAGLVARLGARVTLVPGDARAFKVTTPGDLQLAAALARTWDTEGA